MDKNNKREENTMSKAITVGGKSYEVSEEISEKISESINDEEVVEVESMKDFIGKKLAFQCARYIYFGKVVKVNETFIELDDAQTIYETGGFSNTSASDAQDMPKGKTYLMRQAIESIFPTKWAKE